MFSPHPDNSVSGSKCRRKTEVCYAIRAANSFCPSDWFRIKSVTQQEPVRYKKTSVGAAGEKTLFLLEFREGKC